MLGYRPRETRVIVISDLHLGGGNRPMMSRPARLACFLEVLALEPSGESCRELVIAGDFIDFLAIEPWSSWTPEDDKALTKLQGTMDDERFRPIFDALSQIVRSGWKLTILLGNHDLEMALPAVQNALLTRLVADPHQVCFVDDGRAYRIGRLLIEHGNRYDAVNANDWESLRLIASAQSRMETSPVELRISMGSQFVEDHVNSLKSRYPFLDLIQPQNELVALLLLAFEPGLAFDWKRIAATRKASRLQFANSLGLQPDKTYQIAGTPLDTPSPELAALFGKEYDILLNPPDEVGVVALVRAYLYNRKDSLSEILARGEPIPADRLAKIRALLRDALLNDVSSRIDGPTEQYGKAAARMIGQVNDVEAVIMGHTHLARKGRIGAGWYLNTGTWIDRIRVPDEALKFGADEKLEVFLKDLIGDKRPESPAHYAEALVDRNGHVAEIELVEVLS